MDPRALKKILSRLVAEELRLSAMIWGPPGIGKSSIVAQIARERGLELIDVRLSQLAPTDLRGLPVPSEGISRWYPPEFLPQQGAGILLLDEFNMAPPAVQGIAQQLILDRKVGLYQVPSGWFIWAAGNRKQDRAAVFDMPSPLANRFIHLEVEPDFESFRHYAHSAQLHEQILAFLSFRPSLLHRLDSERPAWPSPRSWEMASRLHSAGLDVEPALGAPAAAEFSGFLAVYEKLGQLEDILKGQGTQDFPAEPSARYAITVALALRAEEVESALRAFRWMADSASAEWVQLFVSNLSAQMRARGKMGVLAQCISDDKRLQQYLADFHRLLAE